ncbi:DUF2244 domain-containing protein [Caulobacter sp. 602-1]|uniref:DUF2244 domain-containing protein n=1 Tax=unclassified Caulobacter TaxID=2648921 RepID=UPI000F6388BF|nr:DUF2244 domain-containing protein [Caulobacter sp. 602-1]RRN62575.1 DUF2244 domain-containing protein [Caulobacter sp. 602-1]
MALPIYMDRVIAPHRSLTPRGAVVLLAVVMAFNVMVAIFLLVVGAPPVLPFLGLDVLALWLALRASDRAARRVERVQVTAEAVTVSREDEKGARTVWTSPTAFTRVGVDHLGEHEARVRLMIYRKRLTLARSLSPDERVSFAQALQDAIRAARAERWS